MYSLRLFVYWVIRVLGAIFGTIYCDLIREKKIARPQMWQPKMFTHHGKLIVKNLGKNDENDLLANQKFA